MPLLPAVLHVPDNRTVPVYHRVATLNASQIFTLNSKPFTILNAPGPGLVLALKTVIIEVNRTATAFTGGGAFSPVYAGATGTALTPTAPATDITGAAGQTVRMLPVLSAGLMLTANTAIQLFAAGADFAAGTGYMVVFADYSVIDL